MNAKTVSFSIYQAAENIPTSRGRNIAILHWLQRPAAALVPGDEFICAVAPPMSAMNSRRVTVLSLRDSSTAALRDFNLAYVC
jgi:hypothetical protein